MTTSRMEGAPSTAGSDPPDSTSGTAAADGRGHRHLIRLELGDISQLFNSMDPSPFLERDIDDDAEEFIVSWAREFPPNARLKLRIYLQQWPAEDPSDLIAQAVHNYFSHRASLTALEFRRLMKQARTSLLIGLAFLAICLSIRALVSGQSGAWAGVLRESLTIAGWVAMWRPMQMYLYDWWPLRRMRRTYVKLSRMPVEVTQHNR